MIILNFHLQPQFKYELFHIYFTYNLFPLKYDYLFTVPKLAVNSAVSGRHFQRNCGNFETGETSVEKVR